MADKVKYAVLGHPIGHSLSPVMHNAAFKALDMDAVYIAIDVPPEELMTRLDEMRREKFGGINLTIPLKETAFNGLEQLDEAARRLGAVNTIQFQNDGSMKGYNTDGNGFLLALEEAFKTGVKGLSVFILGSGGAGRAVALTCAANNAKQITVADLNTDRARQLADEISSTTSCPAQPLNDPTNWKNKIHESDLIVQATPVGMKESDKSPLMPDSFRKDQIAFDLVYMYPQTDFMRCAEKAGARAVNGLGMLLHQGACALNIWTGKQPPINIMREALESKVYHGVV